MYERRERLNHQLEEEEGEEEGGFLYTPFYTNRPSAPTAPTDAPRPDVVPTCTTTPSYTPTIALSCLAS